MDLGAFDGNVHSPRKQEVGRRLSLPLVLWIQNGTGAGNSSASRRASALGIGSNIEIKGPSLISAVMTNRNNR
jgi:hypothetical protein